MQQLKIEHSEMVNNYLNEVKDKIATAYMLTISRDGEDPVRTIIFYDNAIDAAEAFNMYKDWGFAQKYLTIRLYEPSGKINEKIFKRNQAGDPTFLRQNYIDIANILKNLKPLLDKNIYDETCFKIAESFAKDNWRFDLERFLLNLDVERIIQS